MAFKRNFSEATCCSDHANNYVVGLYAGLSRVQWHEQTMVKPQCPGRYRHWLPRYTNRKEFSCDFHLSSLANTVFSSSLLPAFPSQAVAPGGTTFPLPRASLLNMSVKWFRFPRWISYPSWLFSSNCFIEILRSPKLKPLSNQYTGARDWLSGTSAIPGLAWLPLFCSLPTGFPALLLPSHQHGFASSSVLMPTLTKPTVL